MKSLRVFIFLILAVLSTGVYAQNDLLNSDLSTVNVDQLSDDQIRQMITQMEKNGYSLEQMQAGAISRGMSPTEIEKLKARITKLKNSSGEKTEVENSQDRSRNAKNVITNSTLVEPVIKSDNEIFGESLFRDKDLNFQPSLNIPTPQNYILGPEDEVIIDIWGASEQTYKQKITPEGAVIIKNLGPIYLNGITVEEATKRLKKELSKIYSGLSAGNTFIKVSIGNVRSIKVNLVGEAYNPGTYILPSLAAVFNALYSAGGPSKNGTLRDIRVIRDGKTIQTLDLYNFLLKGEQKENIRLEDQDVIFISPYGSRVLIKGEVKRPFIYEVKSDETLADLIRFTGGFTGEAYSSLLKVYRKNGKENQIFDVKKDSFNLFKLQDGDEITVERILKRFENLVEINGAIYRSGQYAINGKLTLKELINKAEGLRGDAFLNRAVIYRTNEDYTMDVIPVDLNNIFQNGTDIELKREDVIVIPSIFDIKETYTIEVFGEVKKPGIYPYVKNTSVEDVIIQAGGLLESASFARIEIARRINNNIATSSANQIAEIFQFPITKDLRITDSASRFVLQPFDQIYIRRSPGYETQSLVLVEGEVAFPGKYSIANKTERISDLITRTGGLTSDAYAKGARLIRKLPLDARERQKALNAIKAQTRDSIGFVVEMDTVSAIGINLDRIIANPKSKYDLLLQEGDILKIPKELQVVNLSGSVLSPVMVRYDKRYSFKDYISNAGGFSPDAKRSKSYVVYANGSIDRTRKILFFNNFPDVEPGAEIIVPKKPERQGLSPQEAVSLGTAVSSMALIIVTLIGNL